MSSQQTIESPIDERYQLRVSWRTVAVFAVVLAYVDGAVVTSLQGAVGAIERNRSPFDRWLRDSTLMVPVYVGAVWLALMVARRWVARSEHAVRRVGASALLIISICSAVGLAEVVNSSAYDYRLQTRHLDLMAELNHEETAAEEAAAAELAGLDVCDGVCAARRSTLSVHVRAAIYAGVVLLLINVVVVAWLLVLRSDRLWVRRVTKHPTRHPEPKHPEPSLS